MKLIDPDTIEFAEDFFFRLSIEQLAERHKEFWERQPFLELFFRGVKTGLKNEFQLEVLWKFVLMTDYCFKSFYGTIPLISKQKISDKLAWIVNDIKKNPEPSGNTNYPKEIARAGQVPMLEFIEAKCESMILEFNNFPEPDACIVFNAIITMTWLYQEEVKKMVPDVN